MKRTFLVLFAGLVLGITGTGLAAPQIGRRTHSSPGWYSCKGDTLSATCKTVGPPYVLHYEAQVTGASVQILFNGRDVFDCLAYKRPVRCRDLR